MDLDDPTYIYRRIDPVLRIHNVQIFSMNGNLINLYIQRPNKSVKCNMFPHHYVLAAILPILLHTNNFQRHCRIIIHRIENDKHKSQKKHSVCHNFDQSSVEMLKSACIYSQRSVRVSLKDKQQMYSSEPHRYILANQHKRSIIQANYI